MINMSQHPNQRVRRGYEALLRIPTIAETVIPRIEERAERQGWGDMAEYIQVYYNHVIPDGDSYVVIEYIQACQEIKKMAARLRGENWRKK